MLVIFDFDGTLADTWPWLAEEIVHGAGPLHYRPVTRDELERLRADGAREIARTLGIPRWRLPSFAAHMRRRAEAAAGEFRLFDGAAALMADLHGARLRLAVASSNSEKVVRHVLGEPLCGLVEAYACNASVFGKQAKFRHILRRTAIRREEAVTVGDEIRDLEASAAVGISAIAVEWGFTDPAVLRRAAPNRTAASFADLRDRLLKLAEPNGRSSSPRQHGSSPHPDWDRQLGG